MTPLALEMLVWFANRGVNKDTTPHPQFEPIGGPPDADAVEALQFLFGHELAQRTDYPGIYGATSKGMAYVDMLLATPIPVAQWVNAQGQFPGKLSLVPSTIAAAEPAWVAPPGPVLPEGYEPVQSVDKRGKFPPSLTYDKHVAVIYRDGLTNKRTTNGATRPNVGEAALFNWKHAGVEQFSLVKGKTVHDRITGNPDDDIIGYALVAPPENKMAMPKAVG